jgi:hypothetical protein
VVTTTIPLSVFPISPKDIFPTGQLVPRIALQTLLPEVVVSLLLLEVERTRPLLKAFGLNLQSSIKS